MDFVLYLSYILRIKCFGNNEQYFRNLKIIFLKKYALNFYQHYVYISSGFETLDRAKMKVRTLITAKMKVPTFIMGKMRVRIKLFMFTLRLF